MADQHAPADVEPLQQLLKQPYPALARVGEVSRPVRVAEAGQIEADHAELRGQHLLGKAEREGRGGEPVHQHDREAMSALAEVDASAAQVEPLPRSLDV